MILGRIIFGAVGILIFVPLLWALRSGGYPSHGERITRANNPIAFWSVMGVTGAAGAFFLLLAITA